MVLDVSTFRRDPVAELLRDDRTGILSDGPGLLRQLLARKIRGAPAVRSPYEVDRAIEALARVGLHVLARLDRLERVAPAPMGAEAEEPPADDTPMPDKRTTWRIGRSRDGRCMGDAIETVLAASEDWMDLGAITSAVNAAGWNGEAREIYVRRVLHVEREQRGWELRKHPDDGRRSQYRRLPAEGR